MQCPFCGGEMGKGIVWTVGKGGIWWLPGKARQKFPLSRIHGWQLLKKGLKESGGIELAPINLTGFPPFDLEVPSFVCKQCKKGIFDVMDYRRREEEQALNG